MQEILNQMYIHKTISPPKKHGIIVSLPKNNGDQTAGGCRPITLMNTDYKLLARIMAWRLSWVLEDQLQSSQFCSVPGNSILETLSVVRDVIAHAVVTRTPLCVLSLDFQSSFNRLSHQYLFRILRGYGTSPWFIERIQSLYANATASVQINGATTGTISLQSAISQGCRLSMALYALCLHPFLRTLETKLAGVQIGQRKRRESAVAYADNVTAFVTHPADFLTMIMAVQTFDRATGALLNPQKSKALVVGNWAEPPTILGIDFCHQAKILGIHFGSTIEASTKGIWASVNAAVRAQARRAYDTSLCLEQRIHYVKQCLLAKKNGT